MLTNLILAVAPVAEIVAKSCTQVEAFLPFTALPKGCAGKRFAIVEVLGEKAPELTQQEIDDLPFALD